MLWKLAYTVGYQPWGKRRGRHTKICSTSLCKWNQMLQGALWFQESTLCIQRFTEFGKKGDTQYDPESQHRIFTNHGRGISTNFTLSIS